MHETEFGHSVASDVVRHLQNGFAACCEDVALPFRRFAPSGFGLCPFGESLELHGRAA